MSEASDNLHPSSFIDWSDAEAMIGLYVELVTDERADDRNDPERLSFLEDLLAELQALEAELPEVAVPAAILRLQGLLESIDPGFAADPVLAHLRDLIDELERVGSN